MISNLMVICTFYPKLTSCHLKNVTWLQLRHLKLLLAGDFHCFRERWMNPSTGGDSVLGAGCCRALHQRGVRLFLGCPSRAERSRVSLCEKCRLTLRTPRSAAISHRFICSLHLGGPDGLNATCTSSAGVGRGL